MNWRDTGKLTVADMCILVGALIGLGIAGLVLVAGALWVMRMMVGG